jgi:hypothetical protein
MQGSVPIIASWTQRWDNKGLRGPGGILLHSPELLRHTRPLNPYLRYEAGLGGRVPELDLVDLVALMGNYAGTAALLTVFDMQLDPGRPPPLPPL